MKNRVAYKKSVYWVISGSPHTLYEESLKSECIVTPEGWISWFFWHEIPKIPNLVKDSTKIPEIPKRFWRRFSWDSKDSDEIPKIPMRFQRFHPTKWHELPKVIHPSVTPSPYCACTSYLCSLLFTVYQNTRVVVPPWIYEAALV